MSGLISILITVIIAGIIFYLLFWLLGQVGLPDPFGKVATVLLCLAAVIYLIALLTGQAPMMRLT